MDLNARVEFQPVGWIFLWALTAGCVIASARAAAATDTAPVATIAVGAVAAVIRTSIGSAATALGGGAGYAITNEEGG